MMKTTLYDHLKTFCFDDVLFKEANPIDWASKDTKCKDAGLNQVKVELWNTIK